MSKVLATSNYIGKDVKIGKNTKIWHLVYIGDKTKIGNNVTIGTLTHIDSQVLVGNDVDIQGMVYIPPFSKIGNNVFIGPGSVFTNDPYPPSSRLSGITIEEEAIIGANSSVLGGVTIGHRSVVGMGSVVVSSVPANWVVAGNPAKKISDRKVYDRKRKNWENSTS